MGIHQVIICCTFIFTETTGRWRSGSLTQKYLPFLCSVIREHVLTLGSEEHTTTVLCFWCFNQNWRNRSPVLGSCVSSSYWHHHLSFGKRSLRVGNAKAISEFRFTVSSQATWPLWALIPSSVNWINIACSVQGPMRWCMHYLLM